MTSLPPKVPARVQNLAQFVSAYNVCLRQEKLLQLGLDNGGVGGTMPLIYIRVLGYLVHHAPTNEGLNNVVREISACETQIQTERELLEVGKYFDHYIRACLGSISNDDDVSPPSFDTITDMIKDTELEKAPRSRYTAKKHALIRDECRCVVTGRYDRRSVKQIQELKDIVNSDLSLRVESTNGVHIFAEFASASVELDSTGRECATTMWGVMARFGYPELADELSGSQVHRLENVFTAVGRFQTLFDEWGVWFVPTSEEDRYKFEAAEVMDLRDYPEYVTFRTHDAVNFPVPSPAYLPIHAACAKVARFSGAAACIDRLYQAMEDATTLDLDGGSAEMLEHASTF
ncbi:hypothetical protein H0H81_011760 [Sphagnurus paluster]|uniref:HNH nuclease domain-containing protein n=1 Tax=Sphagnurus paluster TaxID=117069 RepID=A0A9P7GIB2_9AGAR|nr:hypothetical protein H0H81_011760 [Sphagnurus paluster]